MKIQKIILFIFSVFVFSLLGACNLWGAKMEAKDFFNAEQVELLSAIQKGDTQYAQNILNDGLTLNIHGNEGITPLFWLIMQNDNEAVKRALELGADPNFTSGSGRHPVPTLTGGDDDKLLELLLKFKGNPDAKDLNGKPAIFGAIGHEKWDQIKLLLKYNVDLDLEDGPNRNSAHYAAMLNKFEIAHYLIEQGADPENRNAAGGDIAWIIHEGLTENLINPEFPAYEWALKVKELLIQKGVEFPPLSPKEVREKWAHE